MDLRRRLIGRTIVESLMISGFAADEDRLLAATALERELQEDGAQPAGHDQRGDIDGAAVSWDDGDETTEGGVR